MADDIIVPKIIPTRRLQRLLPPQPVHANGTSFIGMLTETHMPAPLRALLQPILTHDDMGQFEFENGDTARTWLRLLQNPETICWDYAAPHLKLSATERSDIYRQTVEMEREAGTDIDDAALDSMAKKVVDSYDGRAAMFYLLAPERLISHMRDVVLAEVEHEGSLQLEKASGMRRAIFMYSENGPRGWFDVDNGGLIFTSQGTGMLDGVAKIFDAFCKHRIEKGLVAPEQAARPGTGSFTYIHRAGYAPA